MTSKADVVAEAANGVQGIAFSPDQKFIAVMGSIGTSMQLFSKAAPTRTLPQLRTVADPSIAFLDNRRLITFPSIDAPPDTLLEIVDADDPNQRMFTKGPKPDGNVQQNSASSFCLSNDRKTIAVLHQSGRERFIALIDARSMSVRFIDVAVLKPKPDPLISIACSHDGMLVALGSINGTVFLLDALTTTIRSSFIAFTRTLHIGVAHLAISPDGKFIAAGPTQRMTNGSLPDSNDPRDGIGAKLWRLSDGAFVCADGGAGPVRDLSWSHTSRELAIARDDMVSLLDIDACRPAVRFRTSGTTTVAFQPDGERFAFGDDSTVRLSQTR